MPEEVAASASYVHWIGPLLQAGAILVSAGGVALMIQWNRAIARQRAILDLIVKEQTDSDMIAARKDFVNLKKDGNLLQWADEASRSGEQATTIRFILNMYEVVAIGIKKSAYDEAIYRDYCRTTVVLDWIAVKEFVSEYQLRYGHKIFAEFELMAKRWATDKERPNL
ncbi:DUF4760 domain-containing protein [Mesorhizobium sp. SP-1A]|uniref:DUF4760 domain-containing protein n=1 Tax=Mesorhizobium sp. SP-1A TaxID=3077840 RepID=UPI0028F6CE54|nr:DUF4760 domain-containing protein [Mesorhizobium sp. SP-1A]